jgi:hypothetical protein
LWTCWTNSPNLLATDKNIAIVQYTERRTLTRVNKVTTAVVLECSSGIGGTVIFSPNRNSLAMNEPDNSSACLRIGPDANAFPLRDTNHAPTCFCLSPNGIAFCTCHPNNRATSLGVPPDAGATLAYAYYTAPCVRLPPDPVAAGAIFANHPRGPLNIRLKIGRRVSQGLRK